MVGGLRSADPKVASEADKFEGGHDVGFRGRRRCQELDFGDILPEYQRLCSTAPAVHTADHRRHGPLHRNGPTKFSKEPLTTQGRVLQAVAPVSGPSPSDGVEFTLADLDRPVSWLEQSGSTEDVSAFRSRIDRA
jgi:hypothetical protein